MKLIKTKILAMMTLSMLANDATTKGVSVAIAFTVALNAV